MGIAIPNLADVEAEIRQAKAKLRFLSRLREAAAGAEREGITTAGPSPNPEQPDSGIREREEADRA